MLRGGMAVLLLSAGVWLVRDQSLLGALLLGSGGFVLFEALRGWCVLRACRIHTKW